jgi:hypothetical protein
LGETEVRTGTLGGGVLELTGTVIELLQDVPGFCTQNVLDVAAACVIPMVTEVEVIALGCTWIVLPAEA